MRTTAAPDLGFAGDQALAGELFSPAGRIDPHPAFRRSGQLGCRHAVAEQILRSPNWGPPLVDDRPFALWQMFARWLIVLDGERHRTMRAAFGGEFTPRRVGAYRELIERKTRELIDAVIDRGSMDLVTEFARPLPFAVVCGVLGVPAERLDWVEEQTVTMGRGFSNQHEERFVVEASDAVTGLQGYFGQLLDERRRTPRADLMSSLARLPQDPETRADIVANCVFFIEAGHATTVSLIAAGLLLLLESPGQLAAVAADRSLIPAAIEEMLRLVTPTTIVVSRARDADELAGCPVAGGEHRFAWLAAANRDPEVFDDPDTFDATRRPNPHLSFSAGRHFCLGAPLARLHGEIAIERLLERLPGLRLAGEPEWRGTMPLRELERLPVAWG
jgi:cytochrome P450